MNRQFFVRNLAWTTTASEVGMAFVSHNVSVIAVLISYDPATGRPRGFALVETERDHEVSQLVEVASTIALAGRRPIPEEVSPIEFERYATSPPVGRRWRDYWERTAAIPSVQLTAILSPTMTDPSPRTAADRIADMQHINIYLRAIEADCNHVPWVARGNQRTDSINISTIFNDLEVSELQRSEGARDRATTGLRRVPFLEYFTQRPNRLILIHGPFGSGKTTMLKALALRLVSERRKQLIHKSSAPARLPIWLPLARMREQLGAIAPVDASAIWDCLRWDLQLRFGRVLGDRMFNAVQMESVDAGVFLLDGLDDLPDPTMRQAFVDVAARFAAQIGPNATVVISGRPHVREAYIRVQDASILTMSPLSPGLAMEILTSWMRALAEPAAKYASNFESRVWDLSLAISNRNDFRQLAGRPLYLAALATLDTIDGANLSPVELYESIVGLYLSQWTADAMSIDQRHRTELSQFRISEALATHMTSIRSALERLAFQRLAEMSNPLNVDGNGDSVIDPVLVYGIIASVLPETAAPKSVTRFLEERLGILASMSGGYAFPHKSIMEYLAACYIVNSNAPSEAIGNLLLKDPQAQREVLAFAFSKLVTLNKQSAADCLTDVLDGLDGSSDQLCSDLAVGKAVRVVSDHVLLLGVPAFDRYLDRLRERLSENLDVVTRAEIGDVLSCCPDTRPGVGVTSPQHGLPDIAWVRIAPGPVQAGSRDVRDPVANAIEVGLPRSVEICEEFHISRYPVTVVQYQLFVDDGGYNSVEYWTTEGLEWIEGNWKSSWGEGWPWLAKHLETASRQRMPLNWVDQLLFKNRPVVGVSWFEALAYANWLTSRYWASSERQLDRDLVVRLPYELEWEAAARGGDTRQWPWGSFWRQDYANTNESGLDRICAVGLHHASDSPHGVSDMSGNAWDWTLSELGPYGEDLRTVDPSRRDASVTVRGGSWCHDRFSARCAFRDWNVPDDRSDSVGFRLVIGHLAGHVRLGPTSERAE